MGNSPEKLFKIIITPNDMVYHLEEHEFERVGKYYRIPGSNILFEEPSLSVLKSSHKNFRTVKKGVYQEYEIHALYPFESEIKTAYEAPVKKSGTFGSVVLNKTEMVATKTSIIGGMPRDFVKEIAIYRLLSKISCVPEFYNFTVGKTISMNIELGVSSLQNTPIPPENRLSFVFRLLNCMRLVNSQGIIHCDLKPDNIVLSSRGKILIIDWGIASIDHSPSGSIRKNVYIQTLAYRSPEMLVDPPNAYYNYKVDMFSIGLIIYFVYAGKMLAYSEDEEYQKALLVNRLLGKKCYIYEADNWLTYYLKRESLSSHIKKRLVKDLPEDIADLVSHLLEINPQHRWGYDQAINHFVFDSIRTESMQKASGFLNKMPVIPSVSERIRRKGVTMDDRTKVLEWVTNKARASYFNTETLCLAFQLFDFFLFTNRLSHVSLKLLALSCLSISGKIYEPDKLEPTKGVSDTEKLIIEATHGSLIIPSLSSALADNRLTMNYFLNRYIRDDIYSKEF